MTSIKQLKEKIPEYRNIPDLQLADSLYKKFYAGKVSENSFLKTAFPEIAETRPQITPEFEQNLKPSQTIGLAFSPEFQRGAFRPTTKEVAELSGIDVDNPATQEARFAASLGINQEQKQIAIKDLLSKSYGQNIDVRVGPNTGELEYLNPETNTYSLVNKPGVDFGDIAGNAGDAMVIIPEIAATVGVGLATGGVGGISAGAATAFAADYARLKLGQKLYGINNDLGDNALAKRALQTGGFSLAGGALGLFGARGIKGINNIVNGRIVREDFLDAYADKTIADNVVTTINQQLDDANIKSQLKFTLGQATNDIDLLAAQQAFERTQRLGYVGQFREFGIDQATALNDYFKLLRSGFDKNALSTGSAVSPFDAGSYVQNVINKRNDPVIRSLVDRQQQSETLLEKALVSLPDGNVRETGMVVRDIISDVTEQFKKDAGVAKSKLNEAAQLETTGYDIIQESIQSLSNKQRNNLLKLKTFETNIKDDFLNLGKVQPLKTVDTGLLDEAGKPITKAVQQTIAKDQKIPVETLTNTLSELNRQVRYAQTGLSTETVDVGALKQLIGSINKQLRQDTSEAYVAELDRFNQFYKTNKAKLDSTILADLVSIDKSGRLKVADEDVFGLTFKKGKDTFRNAAELYEVIKTSPDAMLAYKNQIFDFYKSKVVKDGVVNVKAHNAFMKDYDSPLQLFFNKTDLQKIKTIGGLQRYIDKTIKTRTKLENDIRKSFEGKISNIAPQDLVKKVFNSNNINDIRKLKSLLQKDPEVLQAFKSAVLSDMNERVTIVPSASRLGVKQIDPAKFTTYLNGKGDELGYNKALLELFGPKFTNNLQTLNRALQIGARQEPALQEGILANAFTDIIRARVGQFTPLGRTLTASRRIYKRASERVLANAILSPESLEDMIRLRRINPRTEQAAYILGSLGGLIFAPNE